jgi:predicted RNA-binding Zn-ribbon protein involved in translation (DUF1610 family)
MERGRKPAVYDEPSDFCLGVLFVLVQPDSAHPDCPWVLFFNVYDGGKRRRWRVMSDRQNDETTRCPECGAEMVPGYLSDSMDRVYVESAQSAESSQLRALICPECGHVKLLAASSEDLEPSEEWEEHPNPLLEEREDEDVSE